MKPPRFVSARLRDGAAESYWLTLIAHAGLERACDERLCAKLAKKRKQAWRSERRVVRRLLRDVAA